MLAIVEQQEQPPRTEQRRDALGHGKIVRHVQAERGCNGVWHRGRIGQRCQLDHPDAIGIVGQQGARRLDGESRLTDAADPRQRDDAMRRKLGGQSARHAVAADELGADGRQIVQCRRRRRTLTDDLVAAPGDGTDRPASGPERLAQGRHRDLQAVFLHDRTGPDTTHDLVFGDELALRLDEQPRDVEGTRAQWNGGAADLQLPPVENDLQVAEFHLPSLRIPGLRTGFTPA